VDSITHALLVATLLIAIQAPALIPFGILGAVILDADILFYLVSSIRPSLYIFIHGGAAHSIAGAAGIAVIAFGALYCFASAWEYFLHFTLPLTFTLIALLAVITGALLHVSLDFLASPGIPLFWPWTDAKYTPGIFAGPSVVMIIVSWGFLIFLIAGILQISALIFYGILFLAYLAISVTFRIAAAVTIKGKVYPTTNPLRWLAIGKLKNCWSIQFVNLLTGPKPGSRTWPALRGVTDEDMDLISGIPEVRRLRYHSCFTVAERNENMDVVIQDPLRVEGIIRYPPYYTRIIVKQKDGAEWEAVTG